MQGAPDLAEAIRNMGGDRARHGRASSLCSGRTLWLPFSFSWRSNSFTIRSTSRAFRASLPSSNTKSSSDAKKRKPLRARTASPTTLRPISTTKDPDMKLSNTARLSAKSDYRFEYTDLRSEEHTSEIQSL